MKNSDYEKEIKKYLDREGIKKYKITEREKGVIPMTCYPFFNANTDSFIKLELLVVGQNQALDILLKTQLKKLI